MGDAVGASTFPGETCGALRAAKVASERWWVWASHQDRAQGRPTLNGQAAVDRSAPERAQRPLSCLYQ